MTQSEHSVPGKHSPPEEKSVIENTLWFFCSRGPRQPRGEGSPKKLESLLYSLLECTALGVSKSKPSREEGEGCERCSE